MSWSYVASSAKKVRSASATSLTTAASAITAGDLLIIAVNSEAYATHGASSNPAEDWVKANNTVANSTRSSIFFAVAGQTTNYTFTGTVGTADYLTVFGLAFRSDVGAPTTTDNTSTGTGTGTALAVTSFSVSATALVVAAGSQIYGASTHNFTAGTDYTIDAAGNSEEQDADNYTVGAVEYDLDAASTETCPMTSAISAAWAMVAAAFVEESPTPETDQKTFRFFSAGDELPHYDTGTTPVIEAGDITHTNDTDADDSKAISYPAYANGSLVIMAIATDAAVTHTLPANGPNSETISIICEDQSPGAGGPTFSVFYYVATAAQGSPGTLTVTLSAAETASCECIIVPPTEFDAAAPIDSNSGAGFQTSGTGETISMPAFSCVRAGGRLLVVGGVDTDPMDDPFSPSGYTDRAGAGRDDGAQNSFVATRDAATSAAESIATAAFGINTGDTAACIGIVVNAPRVADGRTPFAAAGADVELEVDTDYGWQVRVESTGAATTEDTYKIQYKLNAGSWTDVTSSSSVVKASATADFANGADVSEYLGGTGTYITNNNAALDTTGTLVLAAVLGAGQAFEAHLNFQIVSADVSDNDTIQLRVVYEDGTALTSYTDTPTITVNKPGEGGTILGQMLQHHGG